MNWKLIVALLAASGCLLLQSGNVLAQAGEELDSGAVSHLTDETALKWSQDFMMGMALDSYAYGEGSRIPQALETLALLESAGFEMDASNAGWLEVLRLMQTDEAAAIAAMPEIEQGAELPVLAMDVLLNAIPCGCPELADRFISMEGFPDGKGSASDEEVRQVMDMLLQRAIREGQAGIIELFGEHGAKLGRTSCETLLHELHEGRIDHGFMMAALRSCGLREDGGEWMDCLSVLLQELSIEELDEICPRDLPFALDGDYDNYYFLPPMCIGDPAKLELLVEHGMDLQQYCREMDFDPLADTVLHAATYVEGDWRRAALLELFRQFEKQGLDMHAAARAVERPDRAPGYRSADRAMTAYGPKLADWENDPQGTLAFYRYILELAGTLNGEMRNGGNILHRMLGARAQVPDAALLALVELGADPLQRDEEGQTAVSLALQAGRRELATLLLGDSGLTDLPVLAMLGNTEDCIAGLSVLSGQEQDAMVRRCMLAASQAGKLATLNELSAMGWGIPLETLISCGSPDYLARQLEAGNYVVQGSSGLGHSLELAVRQHEADILATLLDFEPYSRWLTEADLAAAVLVAVNSYGAGQLELLLGHGARASAPYDGRTMEHDPLNRAVQLGWMDGVRILLEHGVDPNRGLEEIEEYEITVGLGPMNAWCFGDDDDPVDGVEISRTGVIRLLAEYGARADYYIAYGEDRLRADYLPLLNIVSFGGDPEVMKAMLEIGADPSQGVINTLEEPAYFSWYVSLAANLCRMDQLDTETAREYFERMPDDELLMGVEACLGQQRMDLFPLLLGNLDAMPAVEAQQQMLLQAVMYMQPTAVEMMIDAGYDLPEGDELVSALAAGAALQFPSMF
ncbi:hypothetical protein KDL29_12535 [bacterium]|nr:hypothetical protein [bacterium]UNM09106.1 MAG: hypothetical protein H7A35_03430 [Planctomycetales bacterium]